ncbi:MAG: LLM class flavin-dependent oxidoreductase [Chloroflexi bacterium]|nr:MAG: LLM class flavin-dependent oxidoreductase [Chloroflexota bacterium]MBL1195057.1 LLM class flavin-dependent oxidoreductase [Chloroflexota bacterium]NOH12345.1 LLM class flavin-dependent oxidoreductase [Chloroflexota bacterium]
MSKTPTFGVNVNNREPLIAPGYTLQDLLDLSVVVDEVGFDSVWVGDSLFSKPRYEPMMLMAAISQITKQVRLGTACLVSATRNPLYLALEWATLDQLAQGRTILGACMGSPEEGVRREYAALGLDFTKRAEIFEEGMAVLRELWIKGETSFQGNHFQYDSVSFYSGTEMGPLMPVQSPPPIWVVSNPRLVRGKGDETTTGKVISKAAKRIAKYGDGWMTCCRAAQPQEFIEQREQILEAIDEIGGKPEDCVMSYQVTMNIADSKKEAQEGIQAYISEYYPELSQKMDISEWGPVGTPDDIMDWLTTFADAGVDYFICRFGSLDQFGQVERFAKEIFPEFAPEKS